MQPSKIHDLITLMHDCCDSNKDIFKLSKSASRLNAYSTKTRYPDNAFVPTENDVVQCLLAIEEIAAMVEKLLKSTQSI